MAAKTPSVKRYVVRLSAEERRQLEATIRKGKSAAQRLLKARIVLKADVSDDGEGWSDSRIIEALDTSVSMVYRVRKQLVEEGLEAARGLCALEPSPAGEQGGGVRHRRGRQRLDDPARAQKKRSPAAPPQITGSFRPRPAARS